MTKDQLEALFDQIRAWPAEKQADFAAYFDWLERREADVYVLSDEERAAVRRGLDDAAHGRFATKEEMDEIFGRARSKAK